MPYLPPLPFTPSLPPHLQLLACVPKLAKLSSKLQAIAGQVEKKEFPSVVSEPVARFSL